MQSIRPPSFMTGRGPPPTKPCAFAYANTLAKNPQLHFFFPLLPLPYSSTRLEHIVNAAPTVAIIPFWPLCICICWHLWST